MNFMAYGLPVLAAVNPAGEVARIVRESRAGWVVDASDADAFPRAVARLAWARDDLRERAAAARAYAREHFAQAGFAARFERTLESVLGGGVADPRAAMPPARVRTPGRRSSDRSARVRSAA
jgi:glycosyltransferase involved in cell wall biosynthesis